MYINVPRKLILNK